MSFHLQMEHIDKLCAKMLPYIVKTPLEWSPFLSEICGTDVFLKLENYQLSGSFKMRGVVSKFLTISPHLLAKGVIAASTGNHAAAMGYAARRFNFPCTIYLPENANAIKKEYLKCFPVDLVIAGKNSAETEEIAFNTALQYDKIFFHPYNDHEIIRGQASIGIELLEQLPQVAQIFIPVGGGGLISGISSYVKSVRSNVKIIGCQPLAACEMAMYFKYGVAPETMKYTGLSDATSGGIDKNAVTPNIITRTVDDFVLLTEPEIEAAIRLLLQHHQMIVEGGAALSIAAAIKNRQNLDTNPIVCIVSGKRLNKSLTYSDKNFETTENPNYDIS